MKIIFLKDIPGAKKNQIKEVANGYALNYLLPNNLAIVATPEKIAKLETINNPKQKQNKKTNNEAEKILKTIKNLKISFIAKANKEGHLFGGISSEDIQNILKEKHNLDINKETIELPRHLKKLGEHEIIIKINDQQAKLKIIIKAE